MNRGTEPRVRVPGARRWIRFRYLGGRSVEVVGPATGRLYRFSGMERDLDVDSDDAGPLLRNPAFRAIGMPHSPSHS